MRGQRVPVRDEKEAVVFLLKLEPVREGAEIVAQMEAARRPHAAEDTFAFWHGGIIAKKMEKRKGKMVSGFRFQVSGFRFQVVRTEPKTLEPQMNTDETRALERARES
jgi:hypothetical protein